MAEGASEIPNIYTVVQCLRSLHNDITVQSLSAQLNVSYSTLARCKSGICPPSVTYRALAAAFDTYKERYFAGNERLMASTILEFLTRQGLATDVYARIYEDGGWEELVAALLRDALRNSRSANGTASNIAPTDTNTHDAKLAGADTAADGSGTRDILVPTSAESAPTRPGGIAYGLAGWVPIAVVVGIGLLQIPLNSLLGWLSAHFGMFCALSLAIAACPTVLGLVVDAPIAWARYKRRNPKATFTWDAWRAVARYGAPETVEPGEGRFNTSRGHLAFGLGCNMLGCLCAISLFSFLAPLPRFLDYVSGHNWTEYFKAAMVLAFFIAYHHTASQQNLPRLDKQVDAYNPDNYRYNRAHVWANIVHLVWVITFSTIFALCMLSYSIAHFQQFYLPLAVLWPVAQTAAFLVYANISPYAIKMKVTSAGSFAAGLVAIAVCMVGMVACYRPSPTSVVAVFVYICLAFVAIAWYRGMGAGAETHVWLENARGSRVYSVLIAAVVVGLAVVGFATSTLA